MNTAEKVGTKGEYKMSSKRDVHLYVKKEVYEKAEKVALLTETPINVVLAMALNEDFTLTEMFNIAVAKYGKH